MAACKSASIRPTSGTSAGSVLLLACDCGLEASMRTLSQVLATPEIRHIGPYTASVYNAGYSLTSVRILERDQYE